MTDYQKYLVSATIGEVEFSVPFTDNVMDVKNTENIYLVCDSKNVLLIFFLWSVMVERFSAFDLCSDSRVVRMWVRTPTTTVALMSLSKTVYHNCFSPPRSKWVPVRAELVVVFD